VQVVDEVVDGKCFDGVSRLEEAAKTCAQTSAWLKSQEPEPPSAFENLLTQLQRDLASLRQRLTSTGGDQWKSNLGDLAGAAVSIAMILLLARFLVAKGLQPGARTEAANRLFDRLEHRGVGDDDVSDESDGDSSPNKGKRAVQGSRGGKQRAESDTVPLDAEEGPEAVKAAAAYAKEMQRRSRPQAAAAEPAGSTAKQLPATPGD
jgi:hypothetical protein